MTTFGKVIVFAASLIATQIVSLAESPKWPLKTTYSTIEAKVINVTAEGNVTLVTIDTGSQSNLRIGAVCKAYRGKESVGDIVIVEATKTKCVGIVKKDAKVLKGDTVSITPAN